PADAAGSRGRFVRGDHASVRGPGAPGPPRRRRPGAGRSLHPRPDGGADRGCLPVPGGSRVSSLKINSYYMDQPGDGPWVWMKNPLTRRPIPSFPRTLQIQTFTGCNADCIFCPYGETYTTQPKGKMPIELFHRIIDEASEHGVRRISPYLMNEPLMDRDLFDKVRYINEKIPDCKVVVTTNGHFLTPPVVDKILEMGDGLHKLYVSFQGIDKEAYAQTMRGNMDFDRTMANVDHFIETQRRRGLERPQLWITMVDTAVIDARKAVAFWRSR